MWVLPFKDWNDVFWSLGYISLALAILLFAFSYLTLGYVFRLLFHRSPSQKDVVSMKRFIAAIAIFSFAFIVVAIAVFILKASFNFSLWLSFLLFKENTLLINLIGVGVAILIFGFIYWLVRHLWSWSKNLPDVENDPTTEAAQLRHSLTILNKKLDKLDKLDSIDNKLDRLITLLENRENSEQQSRQTRRAGGKGGHK